ncbi:MAG: HlyD family secretion protein [Gemmatimonadales bacterium]
MGQTGRSGSPAVRRSVAGYWPLAIGYGIVPLAAVTGCWGGGEAFYEARGTVEVHEVDLGAPLAARVVAVRVDEGTLVQAGDTLAVLTQAELPATLAAAGARVATAEATLRDLQAGARPQEIRQAEAAAAAAEADALRTRQALERARALVATNAISRQQYDDAVAANQVAEQRVREAREALALTRAGARPEHIAAAGSELAAARAALRQIEARAGDLVLTSPIAGIVLSRNAEPGEALGPHVPVLTVGETARPYVRVYVPQDVVSWLKLGTPVEIVVAPDATLPGRVAAINPQAEFTPRVALTEEERADLMFGVKVEFANPGEAPNPGLWVTVRVPKEVTSAR